MYISKIESLKCLYNIYVDNPNSTAFDIITKTPIPISKVTAKKTVVERKI